jgi:hypothetical protein
MTKISYFDLDEAARLFNPPAPIISDYEPERLAQRANYERLRQERLQREANSDPLLKIGLTNCNRHLNRCPMTFAACCPASTA